MDDDEVMGRLAEATRLYNCKLHADQLSIPILKDLTPVDDANPQMILCAVGNGFIEQLISNGHVDINEFDQRVKLSNDNTIRAMESMGYGYNIIYYRDYDNGVFNFKQYVCDMTLKDGDKEKIWRSFRSYFFEPKMHDMYLLSLSVGPYDMPTIELKPGAIDLQNDRITIMLDLLMKELMDNLKYRK